MGIIARLARTITSEADNPLHKTARRRPDLRRAARSSPEWLWSIRSLAAPTELSRGGVIVPLPALSDLLASAAGSIDPDQFKEDGKHRC
jgi:hypothetical protein